MMKLQRLALGEQLEIKTRSHWKQGSQASWHNHTVAIYHLTREALISVPLIEQCRSAVHSL